MKRPRVDLLGAQDPITFTLDGRNIARLRPGASVSRDIDPGCHRLQGVTIEPAAPS